MHKQVIKNSILMLKSIKAVQNNKEKKEKETSEGFETNRKDLNSKINFRKPIKSIEKIKSNGITWKDN